MNKPILIRGGLIVDWLPLRLEAADLLVDGGRIVKRADDIQVCGAVEVQAGGRLVMPGWVIAHHHLYSTLARGMPGPPETPRNFLEILQWIWWVLDRCLDLEAVRYSALMGGIEALQSGVTFIVDHHASPAAIRGSLSTIAEALSSLGVRSSLSYEVSGRDGERARREGICENRDFEGIAGWSWPFPGGHASFTLSSSSLEAFSERGAIHVHLLEDPCDRIISERRCGASPVERMAAAGLIGPDSLFVHGVHLTDAEFEQLAVRGAWLAYNPRSNAGNGVGTRTLERYMPIGCLGTDGVDSDLWTEIKFAYLKACEARVEGAMDALLRCLQNNFRLASRLSGLSLGNLVEGAPADLMILDYPAPTPLTRESFLGHLVFGMGRQHVRDVMVGGQWRVSDRIVTSPPAGGVPAVAQTVARQLWARMDALWTEHGAHPFLKGEG